MMRWDFLTAAADALMVQFEEEIDLEVNAKVHRLAYLLNHNDYDWVVEVVPSYRSLLLYYDVLECNEAQIKQALRPLVEEVLAAEDETQSDVCQHQIDVCYDAELGIDLETVAATLGMSTDEVVRLHTDRLYHVYTLGFAPGFAYMGDVDEKLRVARHDTPRQKVVQGSVAIAGQQTALYPQTSPGGWQVIGRAVTWPRLTPGDKVQFNAISRAEFAEQCKAHGVNHD